MPTHTEYPETAPAVPPGSHPPRFRLLGIGAIVAAAAVLAACSGSDTAGSASTAASRASTSTASASATSPTTAPGPDPNAPEVVTPGDIPDNQVFVPYAAAGGFRVDVPEGWSRTDVAADHVVFSDKYNSIDLTWAPQASAPSEADVRAALEAAAIPDLKLSKLTTVQRSAGPVIEAVYGATSEPNAVTGKRIVLDVEQYTFWNNGTAVTVTLSGAKGSDNVDPWKKVTDSLAWSA